MKSYMNGVQSLNVNSQAAQHKNPWRQARQIVPEGGQANLCDRYGTSGWTHRQMDSLCLLSFNQDYDYVDDDFDDGDGSLRLLRATHAKAEVVFSTA